MTGDALVPKAEGSPTRSATTEHSDRSNESNESMERVFLNDVHSFLDIAVPNAINFDDQQVQHAMKVVCDKLKTFSSDFTPQTKKTTNTNFVADRLLDLIDELLKNFHSDYGKWLYEDPHRKLEPLDDIVRVLTQLREKLRCVKHTKIKKNKSCLLKTALKNSWDKWSLSVFG